MKTTVEISEKEIEAVQRLTGARTAEEAVSKAITTVLRHYVGDRSTKTLSHCFALLMLANEGGHHFDALTVV